MKQSSLKLKIGALAILVLNGCAPSYTLRMRAVLEPRDTSSVSPKLKNKKYDRIMIMPPSGTARGAFDNIIALFEKEFIKNGITPINGAVTGRVVMEKQGERGEKKDEGAQTLSDVERALIMAKETGADAMLQIGQFGLSEQLFATRYFVLDGMEYRETTMEEFQAWRGDKRSFQSPWFTFIGRLTDVQTGEVMASFKVESGSNWNLPGEYVAEISNQGVISESFTYQQSTGWDQYGNQMSSLGDWLPGANERTMEKVIGQVAKSILMQ